MTQNVKPDAATLGSDWLTYRSAYLFMKVVAEVLSAVVSRTGRRKGV
jgi:hypothetical protein